LQPIGEFLNQPGGLAERLQRIRKAARLTGDQLAAQLGWARSKVPKLENGRQMPTEADITAWTTACGQPSAAPELLALLSDAQAVHRQWRLRGDRGHAGLQDQFDTLVRNAARIRNFEIFLIPGLLQTPGYARYRALEAVRIHGADASKTDDTVAARMHRQDVLYDTSKTFEFIITEAALRYLLCPPDVMYAQLDRLATISEFTNVTLGIIPPGRELHIAPMVGYLTADDTTIIETFTSADTLKGSESDAYNQITDELLAEAVTGDGARLLITEAADHLRTVLHPRLRAAVAGSLPAVRPARLAGPKPSPLCGGLVARS
jgi:transcriptional regulator with XRE-family HTH domain